MELDESFFWPEGTRPNVVHDNFDFELPVVDLAPVLKLEKLREEVTQQSHDGQGNNLRSGVLEEIRECEAATADLTRTIREACEEYGFFQIINHDLPIQLVEQLSDVFAQMFDLPLEEKLKVSQGGGKGGYTPFKRTSPFTKNDLAHIWNEGFNIDLPSVHNPGQLEQVTDNLWPEQDPSMPESRTQHHLFRSTVDEYGKKSSNLTYRLLDLMATSLGLPEDSVDSLVGSRVEHEVPSRLRGNYYPICTQPELTWGSSAHTDPSMITLLHQDAIGGLQIRFVDRTWHGVRPIPGAFVVNVGDYLQAWTNGRFVSAEHQVVTNEKQSRLSIAYFAFFSFNHGETIVSPRPELVDALHPLRYKPFTQQQYFKALLTHGLSRDRGQLLNLEFAAET